MNNHTLQNTKGEPIRLRNDPSRNRPTEEVPFIAGCSHFTRKKRKVSCFPFLPKTNPMQQPCSYYNAFCSMTRLTRISLRTWRQNVTTIVQPLRRLFYDVLWWCYVMYCYVMLSLTPPFSHHPSWCIFMWCNYTVTSWCIVTWIKIISNSENCFPTSFDQRVTDTFPVNHHELSSLNTINHY